MNYDLTCISLGAGVQSTTLLVMAALGMKDCPRATVAVFADTQSEPPWVYESLSFYEGWAKERGVEVVRVTRGCLKDAVLRHVRTGSTGQQIPVFLRERKTFIDQTLFGPEEKVEFSDGILQRNCTRDYKIEMIQKEIKRRLEVRRFNFKKSHKHVLQLIGISTDEAHRMTTSREPWITNCYPLVDAGMSREDCESLLRGLGLPVPKKSACTFCPFHSDAYWLDLKRNHPDLWQECVEFDKAIRRLPMLRSDAFLHDSRKPLDEAILDVSPEKFGNECKGVCGV